MANFINGVLQMILCQIFRLDVRGSSHTHSIDLGTWWDVEGGGVRGVELVDSRGEGCGMGAGLGVR